MGASIGSRLENKAEMQVIGNDQGLLSAPVAVKRVPLAPAERVDVVVDFAAMAGTHVKLVSDSFDIMEFRVAAKGTTDTSTLPATLRPGVAAGSGDGSADAAADAG